MKKIKMDTEVLKEMPLHQLVHFLDQNQKVRVTKTGAAWTVRIGRAKASDVDFFQALNETLKALQSTAT